MTMPHLRAFFSSFQRRRILTQLVNHSFPPAHSLKSVSVRSMIPSRRSFSQPRTFPSTGFQVIDPSSLIEEERIPNYKAQRYYPASIGEILHTRYQIISKLGYGSSSTVWLCRDLNGRGHEYVALKIYVNSSARHRELPIYNRINQIRSSHPGRQCLRMLLDSFEIAGPYGRHRCLVHQPLGMSLYDLQMRSRNQVFNKDVLRTSTRQLLAALDFLHTEAHIIHTDLQPSNLLMGINDKSVLSGYEKDELEHPVPRKVTEDRTIYLSRPPPLTFGPPILCDLGEARLGDEENRGDIMPDIYRAPEVILCMKWSYSVDIWNVAMVIWDLFEHDHIFQARNPENEYDEVYHLAEMVAILGPPPLDFLKRSENSLRYWDETGNWRGLVPIPKIGLEQLEQRLDSEDKNLFLQFIRKMLCWIPEERPTASEVIFDPWLMEGLFDP